MSDTSAHRASFGTKQMPPQAMRSGGYYVCPVVPTSVQMSCVTIGTFVSLRSNTEGICGK